MTYEKGGLYNSLSYPDMTKAVASIAFSSNKYKYLINNLIDWTIMCFKGFDKMYFLYKG